MNFQHLDNQRKFWIKQTEAVKKSLKIPKVWSESVNRSRTDNTMAKIKVRKGQTTIYKTYT